MTEFLLHINGQWRQASGGKTAPVINPATEIAESTVALADSRDLEAAVEAAESGFSVWSRTSPVERGAVLRRAAQILRDRSAIIAPQITREQGKTLMEAKFEALVAADILEWFAEEARRAYGWIVPSRVDSVDQFVFKKPVGPVAGFVPWNFGLGQAARKVGPALAAGCSLVLKGPEEAPASCAVMVEALVDAGLPPGVINLIFGVPAQISEYLIPHPAIRKVSFTGSTAVGKHLASLAGQHMKPVTMELGGHSPVIVTSDVDVETTAKNLVVAKFRNAGQACISPTRFIVQDTIYEKFIESFVSHASQIKVGDGLVDGTQMGPLANARRLEAMDDLLADGVSKGGKIRLGGRRIGNSGYFFEPTVISDVPVTARLLNEEPFGPIAVMNSFSEINDAISEANRLDYGLAGYAYTGSDTIARRISHEVEVGMLSINSYERAYPEVPYGGLKDSGLGSEGGLEAIQAFLTTRYVARGS